MAKPQKQRNMDFSHKEMEDFTGLPRQVFDNRLKRVCELYGFDEGDFKLFGRSNVAGESKNSATFFPPEIAELLALLVKNVDKHPLYRKNADVSGITASMIADYNRALLADIDEIISPVFRVALYDRPSLMVAQRISDWSDKLVKQLTHFLINNVTLKNQDIGSALREYARDLDSMNYNLFKGDYWLKMAEKSNMETLGITLNESEIMDREQNVPLDATIANLIKCGIQSLDVDREVEIERNREMSREEYYERVIRPWINASTTRYEYKRREIDYIRERDDNWLSIEDEIRDGIFREPYELSLDEKIENAKLNLQRIKQAMDECEAEIEQLEQEKEKGIEDEDSNSVLEFLQQLKNGYVSECEYIDKEFHDVKDVTDKFIGQAMYQFMHR